MDFQFYRKGVPIYYKKRTSGLFNPWGNLLKILSGIIEIFRYYVKLNPIGAVEFLFPY